MNGKPFFNDFMTMITDLIMLSHLPDEAPLTFCRIVSSPLPFPLTVIPDMSISSLPEFLVCYAYIGSNKIYNTKY